MAILTLPVAMRSAEARGVLGAEAVGQAVLHVLAVVQVGLGAVLLNLVPTVRPAWWRLAFYAWAGAVDALRSDGLGTICGDRVRGAAADRPAGWAAS